MALVAVGIDGVGCRLAGVGYVASLLKVADRSAYSHTRASGSLHRHTKEAREKLRNEIEVTI